MKLRDILLTGMDIPTEAQNILGHINVTTTNGMTTSEYKAYKMGVENALNAVRALLEQDEHLVFHIEGHDCIEEFDLDDFIEIIEHKGEY